MSVQEFRNELREYDYFLDLPVHDRVGYSTNIYHLTVNVNEAAK